jgi:hypothetical protein
MEQLQNNQRALSVGYIALKRIRALDSCSTRLPSSPLFRHLSHLKILAACVEQVGPDEIISYEMNQDARDEAQRESPFTTAYELYGSRRHSTTYEGSDDVYEERYRISSKIANTTRPLEVIKEVHEDIEDRRPIDRDIPLKPLLLTEPTPVEFDAEDDYSMDELYDEYNSQEDDWETASDVSEDDHGQYTPTTSTAPRATNSGHSISPTSEDDEDESEEDTPSTPPPNLIISRSPPLDITMRHPITHSINKREQYRKELQQANSDLSCAFVEQIEDTLCHQLQYLSMRGIPGQMRLENHAPQRVSLFA